MEEEAALLLRSIRPLEASWVLNYCKRRGPAWFEEAEMKTSYLLGTWHPLSLCWEWKERRKISAAAEVAERTANERSRTEMKQTTQGASGWWTLKAASRRPVADPCLSIPLEAVLEQPCLASGSTRPPAPAAHVCGASCPHPLLAPTDGWITTHINMQGLVWRWREPFY